MGIRAIAASLVLATGLAGCATDPGAGLRYADGSYYAMPGDGRGDYYVGRDYANMRYRGDPFFDDFAWLYYGGSRFDSWYGSPFYGYGGYCSVRYRYCPRGGWADPFPRYDFRLRFGDPWYGYRGHDRWRPPSRRTSRPPTADTDAASNPPIPRQRAWPRREERRPGRPVRDVEEDRGTDRSSAPQGRRAGMEVRRPAPRRKDGN